MQTTKALPPTKKIAIQTASTIPTIMKAKISQLVIANNSNKQGDDVGLVIKRAKSITSRDPN